MEVNEMKVGKHGLLTIQLPRDKVDYKLMMMMVLTDIKTLAGLQTILFLSTLNETTYLISQHIESCKSWCNLDEETFLEGLNELYNLGYLKSQQDFGWIL